jgi:hypothetical protein
MSGKRHYDASVAEKSRRRTTGVIAATRNFFASGGALGGRSAFRRDGSETIKRFLPGRPLRSRRFPRPNVRLRTIGLM